jgi:hypothetical protein
MTPTNPVAGDRTANERRKNLSDEQVKELELAGGVEGGMQAGSAGGPAEEDANAVPSKARAQPRSRQHASSKQPGR